jgi:hypothetical protein
MAMFAVSLAQADTGNYSERRDLSLDATGLTELFIDAGAGYLTVTGDDESSAIVVVAVITVDTRNDVKAKETIERRLELTLDRRGEEATLVSGFTSGRGPGATIDLDVSMPSGFALKIDDGSGSTVIADIRGDIIFDDGSGSIEITNVGSVEVDDGSGSIRIHGATGDVYVNDGSGSIEIHGVGGSVTVDAGSGSIDVEDVEKDLIIENDGSGSLTYNNIRGVVDRDS